MPAFGRCRICDILAGPLRIPQQITLARALLRASAMLTNPAGVNELTEKIIGGAIQVHRDKGPGLLESVYLECMHIELQESGLSVRQKVRVPLTYRGRRLRGIYELDLLVQDRVIVEIRAVSALAPVHKAQLLTYLKLTERPVGLLINFKHARPQGRRLSPCEPGAGQQIRKCSSGSTCSRAGQAVREESLRNCLRSCLRSVSVPPL